MSGMMKVSVFSNMCHKLVPVHYLYIICIGGLYTVCCSVKVTTKYLKLYLFERCIFQFTMLLFVFRLGIYILSITQLQ
jgi:hypothetical protein